MTLRDVADRVAGVLIVEGEHAEVPLRHVIASDMMSEVLLAEEEDLLLVTSLASEHAIRTAHVLGIPGVVVAGGRDDGGSAMARVARDLGVGLVTTVLDRDAACRRIRESLHGH